jgi:hypothetical protein
MSLMSVPAIKRGEHFIGKFVKQTTLGAGIAQPI